MLVSSRTRTGCRCCCDAPASSLWCQCLCLVGSLLGSLGSVAWARDRSGRVDKWSGCGYRWRCSQKRGRSDRLTCETAAWPLRAVAGSNKAAQRGPMCQALGHLSSGQVRSMHSDCGARRSYQTALELLMAIGTDQTGTFLPCHQGICKTL